MCVLCDGSGIIPGPADTFGQEEFCGCDEGEKLGAELVGGRVELGAGDMSPEDWRRYDAEFERATLSPSYEEWSRRVDERNAYLKETEEAPW